MDQAIDVEIIARQFINNRTSTEDKRAMAEFLHLLEISGDENNPQPATQPFLHQRIYFRFRTHIDASCGLLGD